MDKQVRMYSMKRKCRRWPYGFTMNLLDIAVINSMYIFANTRSLSAAQQKKLHYNFLISAGMQLCGSHIKRRSTSSSSSQSQVNRALQVILPSFGNLTFKHIPSSHAEETVVLLEKQQRCHLCPRTVDRKSRVGCSCC